MGALYATPADIRAVGHPLTAAQEETAAVLIEQACARLRQAARRCGKDVDALIGDEVTGEDFALAVRSVVVQMVCRALDSASNGNSGLLTQGSQTLGAYSVQQTFFNPGQSLYFLRNELKELGLYQGQTFGAMELWAGDGDVHE